MVICSGFACKHLKIKSTPISDRFDAGEVQCKNFKIMVRQKTSPDSLREKHITVQAKLILSKDQFETDKNLGQSLQYGLDSAFALISARDTVWPSYVMAVANGQLTRPEFIIEFDENRENNQIYLFKAFLKRLSVNEDKGIILNTN